MKVSRRIIMQKARRHPGIATIGLRPLVGMWFQVQYPPLTGVLPIFRSRYLFTIGRQRVLSLGRWTSQIQTRFHVTGPTRGHTRRSIHFRIRDCHPLWSRFPSSSASKSFCNSVLMAPQPRRAEARRFRLSSFSLAATGGVDFSFLSCGYLDVSVPRVGLVHLWIQCTIIRESRDQRLFDSFPELIAVFHALHRLLTPRHPPHALSSLTTLILASRPTRPL